MTPADRALLIGRAKKYALAFTSAVNTRSAHRVKQITDSMTREELAGLAIALAAAADPAKLRAVVEDPDDGMPEHVAATRGAA